MNTFILLLILFISILGFILNNPETYSPSKNSKPNCEVSTKKEIGIKF